MAPTGITAIIPVDEGSSPHKDHQTAEYSLVHSLKRLQSAVTHHPMRKVSQSAEVWRSGIKTRLEEMNKEGRGLINPRASLVWKLDLVMVVLLFFTASVTPYEVCFLEQKQVDALFFINRVVDLGFLVDMILQFYRMYEDDNGEIVKDQWLIAKRYIGGWFAIDFLSILPIPFDIISATGDSTGGSGGGGKVKALRFARVMRIMKLARIFRLSRIIQRWESQIGHSST
jgi:hypothetical protein